MTSRVQSARPSGPARRWLAPEVIQTSAMDCGPAALKCLLEGFGVPVSYGRLREACQTSVDGTSIDTLESLARSVGLDAEQVMMPVDHLLLPEAEALPAIVVVRLPSGLMHFVVVWRVAGGLVQVMDPARGRRWVRREAFLRDVYVHTLALPADDFDAWARSDGFLDPLRRRLRALGVGDGGSARLVEQALAAPGWRGVTALDAAARLVAALAGSRAVERGADAERLVGALAGAAPADAAGARAVERGAGTELPAGAKADAAPAATGSRQIERGAGIEGPAGVKADTAPADAAPAQAAPALAAAAPPIPVAYTTAAQGPALSDGVAQVSVRGAVLVRVAGAVKLEAQARAQLPRELRAALDEKPARPAAALGALLARDGGLRWVVLLVALALAASGTVLEALLFRGLFDAVAGQGGGLLARLPALGHGAPGWSLAVVTLVVLAALLLVELPVALGLRGAGGRLETRLRRAFLRKIPRLGDRYFQSRPVSDMAERAHLVHRLRALPALAGQVARTALEIAAITTALIWLHPRGAPLALALAATMLLAPLLAQPAMAEQDLRMRNHAGALARFYLDALLGLVAIRTHRAEPAMAREHRDRLGEWAAAARAALWTALGAEAVQALLGFGLAAWLLADFVGSGAAAAGSAGVVLLVVYWALTLPALGQELALLVQQIPGQRNVTLRLVEPLGAIEEEAAAAGEEPAPIGEPNASGGDRIANPMRRDDRTDRGARAPAPAPAPGIPTAAAARAGGARIELRDVSVQVAGHLILTVDALDIAAGEHVAVVGASGAGKSSLVGLLLGWHRPASGVLRVDGAPLDGAALAALRRRTVWVDPGVYVWNRPLADNLTYGLAAPLPDLARAIDEAELDEVVRRLPDGAATPLGEGGALLSGGEGQRVRFARGVLRPRPCLAILDEPFRGLARQQRRALLARARRRWADATLLCVTHDIEETRSFARVLVIADGRVVEDGAPAELRARGGSRYAALLDAETRVRRVAWSGAGAVGWRRLRLEAGQLSAASGAHGDEGEGDDEEVKA